jgi:gliding motility-associated-like protein
VVTLTSSHNPGDSFPNGKTEVKYTATDIHGNASICVFTVFVKNENLPVISNCPGAIEAKGNEQGMASVDWIEPTAVAFCGGITLSSSHKPGDLFAVGTTNVEYKATDDTGNSSYCSFPIIVSQTEIEIGIAEIVTPDGDGINDEWTLLNIEKFKDNKVVIVDRWGSVIFTCSGYNNESQTWRGTSSGGAQVPTGTYFYTLSVRFGRSKIEKSGFIELIR